ncbi:MAG TPA: hypothetical protein VD995_16570 [Azospirillum sp.]|nr:hypothetical protein [Azospirillum sp.]
MPAKMTATVRGEEIPRSLAVRLPEHPIPGMRYRMTLEPVEETDEEKLASLRADLQEGRDAIRAGRVVPADTVFARLLAQYPVQDGE